MRVFKVRAIVLNQIGVDSIVFDPTIPEIFCFNWTRNELIMARSSFINVLYRYACRIRTRDSFPCVWWSTSKIPKVKGGVLELTFSYKYDDIEKVVKIFLKTSRRFIGICRREN